LPSQAASVMGEREGPFPATSRDPRFATQSGL
jgi:hypothetical protein